MNNCQRVEWNGVQDMTLWVVGLDVRGGQVAAKLKTGKCFWSHVEKLDSESPIFYNVAYKAHKDSVRDLP